MSLFGKNRHKTEHHGVDELLSAYLDNALSARERQTVEAHLAVCDHCRWNLETLRQTVQWTRELPSVPLPRVFTIPAPAPARSRPVRRRNWGFGLLQGATALVALFFVVAVLGDFALTGFGSGRTAAVSRVQQEQAVEVLDTQVAEAVMTTVLEMEAPAASEALPLEAAPAPQSTPMRQMVPPSAAQPTETAPASPTPSPEVRGLSQPGFEAAPQEKAVSGEGAPSPTVAAKEPPLPSPAPAITETYGAADTASPEEKTEAVGAGGGGLTSTLEPLAATTVAQVEEPLAIQAPADDEAAVDTWQDVLAPWLRLAEIATGLTFILLATLTIVLVLRSRRLR